MMSEGACSHGADDQQTESARMSVFEEESLKASHLNPEDKQDAKAMIWWRRQAKRLWKGLKRVGTFCLGVMLSLGVMACMGPLFDLRTIHPGNSDIMGTSAHYLMHPYCTCHNFGVPPV